MKDDVFRSSSEYWEHRYAEGGTSGKGSFGKLAIYKATFLNRFAEINRVTSVAEFGSGDGNQAAHFRFKDYTGYDVSAAAVAKCQTQFSADHSKKFFVLDDRTTISTVDLSLSLDVIYHLVEDNIFEQYMTRMLDASARYAIFYSSNKDVPASPAHPHLRHRRFTDWIRKHRPEFNFVGRAENMMRALSRISGDNSYFSFADFIVYAREGEVEPPDVILPASVEMLDRCMAIEPTS